MLLKDIEKGWDFEDEQIEFKARLSHDNIMSWLKTVDGFANAKGGYFFLGVEDKTTKLIGFEIDEIDKEKLFFFNNLNQHFDILPETSTSVINYEINGKTRYLLKIKVNESPIKPLILKDKGMPMIFVRRDGFTNAATTEEIIRMSKSSTGFLSFDNQYSTIDFDINKFKALNQFYFNRTGKQLSNKELGSIGFYNQENKLSKGALLFEDGYSEELTKVVCSFYKGVTRGDDRIISSNTFSGNLIEDYQFIWDFIQARINHGFIKTSTSRKDIVSYPDRSLFEAIINALAHRDYLLSGTQISVDIFFNRIVITSPGSLFNTGDLNPTYDLSSFISRRRNELVSSVFIISKAMEAKGTGFEKIQKDYQDADETHKPFIFSSNNQFSIVLPDLSCDLGADIPSESLELSKPIESQSKYDLRILAFCFSKDKSIKEIVDKLSLSNSTFFRKNVIDRLVNQEFLIKTNKGNKSFYTSNKSIIHLN